MNLRPIYSLSFALLVIGGTLFAQAFTDGYSFHLPWDDSTEAAYLPTFPGEAIDETGRVSVDENGNFIVKDEPYRFFGGNLTTDAAFPDKGDASAIAARMQKFGINLIRFHHIDNPWSEGSLFHKVNGTRSLNAERLDRLDYLIYQLKQHGIYINMNLNVSRTFKEGDGVADADSLSDFGKGVTLFDSHLKALQKEYAGLLLKHVNPYTGMTLAEDPALAMLEIINENSLFRMWYSGAMKPISMGGKMPLYYYRQLDSLWQDFLNLRYTSTGEMAAGWMEGVSEPDTLFWDDFESGTENWELELHEAASGDLSQSEIAAEGDYSVKVDVTGTSSQTWHLQFKTVGARVFKDSIYEVIFKARGDQDGPVSLVYARDNSPWTYYGENWFDVGQEWQEYRFRFMAPEDNLGYLRLYFNFQNNLGSYYIDDFILRTEQKNALEDGESLEERRVALLDQGGLLGFTDRRVMDQAEFLATLQRSFLQEMGTYLRDSVGVMAPMTGTNWFTGPEDVFVQDVLDYVDNHAYWDHPSFPSEPWSATDWTIKNTSMLSAESGSIDALFSGLILKDKPYTVSEYNHAFPNQFQSELLPVISSYLSYNDADAMMMFTYNGSKHWDGDAVTGYFDIHRNNSLMANFPLYAYVYRKHLIAPAEEVLLVNYAEEDIYRMPVLAREHWNVHVPYDKRLAYEHRIEISLDADTLFDPQVLPEPGPGPYHLNEGEVVWEKSGIFRIDTEKFTAVCGELDSHWQQQTKAMQVNSASGFGSVSWLSLVDSALTESSRSLLAIGTSMMNTGMKWDGTITVHNQWGWAPALLKPLELELILRTNFSHMRITPMDETGQLRMEESDTLAADENSMVHIKLDQKEDKTPWYGIESLNLAGQPNGTGMQEQEWTIHCYPNPGSGWFSFEFPGKSEPVALLRITDLLGRQRYEGKVGRNEPIDLSGLGQGTYVYHIGEDPGGHGRLVIMQ